MDRRGHSGGQLQGGYRFSGRLVVLHLMQWRIELRVGSYIGLPPRWSYFRYFLRFIFNFVYLSVSFVHVFFNTSL